MAHRRTVDTFTKLARAAGYPARSVFKLEEANKKFRFLKPKQHIVDLGFSPGSWTLYASKIVGPQGYVLGLDLTPKAMQFPDNVDAKTADVLEWEPSPQMQGSIDVLMSDMAPKTTGQRDVDAYGSIELSERALDLAQLLLTPKTGVLFVKVFQGIGYQELLKRFRAEYKVVKTFKPKSSRKESVEMFVFAKGMK
jgi:23S rRNA (uridine2552-2'-O)-methyltransferase